MSLAYLINGGFEVAGGLFILNHCRVLYRDKMVAGVSKLSTAVFFLWGVWNLYYYPSLNQWLSFYGGIVIVSGNCLWLAMMVYYSRWPGGRCGYRKLASGGGYCRRCGGFSGDLAECARGRP